MVCVESSSMQCALCYFTVAVCFSPQVSFKFVRGPEEHLPIPAMTCRCQSCYSEYVNVLYNQIFSPDEQKSNEMMCRRCASPRRPSSCKRMHSTVPPLSNPRTRYACSPAAQHAAMQIACMDTATYSYID